jgi:hypothetical protein
MLYCKMKNRNGDYDTTPVPTLKNKVGESKEEILMLLYSEVNSNYRHLADIRFKLLGFVPAVSIIAWVEILGKLPADNIQNILVGLLLSMLGFRITFGIRIYDKRNDSLYDDLVSRGRKIEKELGVYTGIFLGRKGKHTARNYGEVNHGRGLYLIYSSVFIGWALISTWFSYNLIIISI